MRWLVDLDQPAFCVIAKSAVARAAERKYFGSGRASKMSDNEHPFPILGDAEILAVKHLPLAIIPQLIKRCDDREERSSAVVTEQALDVLKEKKAWSFIRGQSRDLKEQSASRISEPLPPASQRESLTRKPSADKADVGELRGIELGDVSKCSVRREVALVDLDRDPVDLRETNTYWPGPPAERQNAMSFLNKGPLPAAVPWQRWYSLALPQWHRLVRDGLSALLVCAFNTHVS